MVSLLATLSKGQVMTIQHLMVLSAAALVASMSAGYAGPCSQAIDSMQARVDARLDAMARLGPSAPESSGALLHRQPTPGSIAAAESRLGDLSPAAVAGITAAMARAREADGSGDASACEQALADVQRAISP
jgi:hypothetical protein